MSIKVNNQIVVDDNGNVDWASIKDRPNVQGDQGDPGTDGATGIKGITGPKGRDRTRIQYYKRYRSNCNCNCVSGCSCFPAGSMVLMADGTYKIIETVEPGDQVAGLDGRISTVTSLFITSVMDRGVKRVAGTDFVWSDEHLIWTKRSDAEYFGVFSIPNYEREVEDGWMVGLTKQAPFQLTPNETFAHVDGWKDVEIVDFPLPPETPLYNLVLGEGSQTYFVEDFLVGAFVDDTAFDYQNAKWEGLKNA